jgi:hypothetical protein
MRALRDDVCNTVLLLDRLRTTAFLFLVVSSVRATPAGDNVPKDTARGSAKAELVEKMQRGATQSSTAAGRGRPTQERYYR